MNGFSDNHYGGAGASIWTSLGMLALVAFIAVSLYYALIRGNEIFYVSIRRGKAMLVRGRIPNTLLSQIGDVAQRGRIESASVQAYRGGERARLVASGVSEGDAQRLRNLFSLHPIHALRAAPLRKPENLGQVLGIAWLAWMLTNRR